MADRPLTRKDKLKVRYNTKVETEIKDYLPIIGNEIPNKRLVLFDKNTSLAFTEVTATASGAIDYAKGYHSDSCYKIIIGADAVGMITLDYSSTPINMLAISEIENKFAEIKRTGKYGNVQDKLFTVVNLMKQGAAGTTATLQIKYYAGSTKYAGYNSGYLPVINNDFLNCWRKIQMPLAATADWNEYYNGFAFADWESITKIEIIYSDTASAGSTLYLQDLFVALPKARSGYDYGTTITDSYYPNLPDTEAIFVSWLFGRNENNGQTRARPVKTIEAGVALLTGSRLTLIILDSETYKPITGSAAGIKPALTDNISIIADFLETPKISAKPGVLNAERIGAREYNRSIEYALAGGAGTKRTVGSGGAYATIALAYARASTGDCIEIIDSATYDETIDISGKNLTIQAITGATPKWTYAAGASPLVISGNDNVKVYGITFEGRNLTNSQDILISVTGAGATLTVEDCTFSKISRNGTTTAGYAIYAPNNTSLIKIYSNVFVGSPLNITTANLYLWAVGVGGATASGSLYYENNKNIRLGAVRGLSKAVSYIKANNMTETYYATYSASAGANFNFIFNSVTADAIGSIGDSTVSAVKITLLSAAANGSFNVNSNYIASFAKAIDVDDAPTSHTTNIVVEGNFFNGDSLTVSQGIYLAGVGSNAALTASRNTFINCNKALNFDVFTSVALANNNYISCTSGADISQAGSYTETNAIYLSNTAATTLGAGVTLTETASNFYDNTSNNDGAGTLAGGLVSYDPEFTNVDAFDFSLTGISNAEAFSRESVYQNNYSILVNPTTAAAKNLHFKFLYFEGFYNAQAMNLIATSSAVCKFTYCSFYDFALALNETISYSDVQNCFFSRNGTAIRKSFATFATEAIIKYCIFDGNGQAAIIRSGTDFQYNTAINNQIGVSGSVVDVSYLPKEQAENFITIKNNIIMFNNVYDYYHWVGTDYCIIGTRYYDMLDVDDINYLVTAGDNDSSVAPVLDTAYYFPATIYAGYKENSSAYNTASTANQNIGARYLNHIKAALDYDEYTFHGNPQHVDITLMPVNMSSAYDASGEYLPEWDCIAGEYLLRWLTPGKESKIINTQYNVLQLMFESYWYVGISFDDGTSYDYFRVVKEESFGFKQQKYYYDELPYGDGQMKLSLPPELDITDYEVDTWT